MIKIPQSVVGPPLFFQHIKGIFRFFLFPQGLEKRNRFYLTVGINPFRLTPGPPALLLLDRQLLTYSMFAAPDPSESSPGAFCFPNDGRHEPLIASLSVCSGPIFSSFSLRGPEKKNKNKHQ